MYIQDWTEVVDFNFDMSKFVPIQLTVRNLPTGTVTTANDSIISLLANPLAPIQELSRGIMRMMKLITGWQIRHDNNLAVISIKPNLPL